MNTVERVKMICKERRIPISRLERECGFANGYISQLKKGSIPDDRLQIIADYFEMDIKELLGVQTEAQVGGYYIDEEAAQYGQAIFEDPDLRALFHVVRGIKREDLKLMIDMGKRFKETNPDG